MEANALNQYDSRGVPRFLDVLGEANDSATVTVNGDPTLRTFLPGGSDYFYQPLAYGVDGLAEYERFRITAEDSNGTGGLLAYDQDSFNYLPPAQEDFVHDEDGNLLTDGRWQYTWDSENRLIEMETLAIAYNAGAPRQKLEFQYDSQGRRFSKKVYDWDNASNDYLQISHFQYLYDGWNLIFVPSLRQSSISNSESQIQTTKSFAWGLDLSGSQQGAGGVGGLLAVIDETGSTAYPSYDGNGNIMGYYAADTGESVAEFEYGPFGDLIRATGQKKDAFNFRFSTKYEDSETGLLYYGYRYYNAETGRWLNRDPIGEQGGLNLYAFVGNNGVNLIDILGNVGYSPYSSGHTTFGDASFFQNSTQAEANRIRNSDENSLLNRALETVLKSAFLRCYLLDLTDEDLIEINAVIEREMRALDTAVVNRYFTNIPREAASKFLALNAASRKLLASIPQGSKGAFGIPSIQSLSAQQLNKRRALLQVRRKIRDASIRMVGRGGVKVWGRIGSKILPVVGWFSLGYEAAKACNCAAAAEDGKYTENERLF